MRSLSIAVLLLVLLVASVQSWWFFDNDDNDDCDNGGSRVIRITFPDRNSPIGTATFGKCTTRVRGSTQIDYPTDVTVNTNNKYRNKYSREYNTNMPYAIGPIEWRRGIYLHEGSTYGGDSAGCIAVKDAKKLYDYVTGRTRILISYRW